MERRCFGMWIRWSLLALGVIVFGAPVSALAQSSSPPAAANPSPEAVAAREAQLEERFRQLESLVNKLSTQVNQVPAPPSDPATRGGPDPRGPATPDTGTPATTVAPSRSGGVGAPGQSLSPDPPPAPQVNMPATITNILGRARFGSGFEISTPDNEYVLQFHNITQFNYEGYRQTGQTEPLHDSFVLPYQLFIFNGRLTKNYEYFVSFSNLYTQWIALWNFLDVHYDERLHFRFGKVFTPFGYEWWQVPLAFRLQPELSIFYNNFGPATDLGAFAWGNLFKKRVDYAVGIFNGATPLSLDPNNGKDIISFLNFKPFLESDITALKYLNVGGSVDAGNRDQAPLTSLSGTLQTSTLSGLSPNSPAFLAFNNNVRESGLRALWTMHMAYYYNHLSVISEWQSGYQTYALANTPTNRTRVPIEGFYVAAGYFLTGETVSARNILQPIHDFDIRKGRRGLGAIELTARYSLLDLGSQIFKAGLADPNLWTNRVSNVNIGVDWYLTRAIKLYAGWQHDMFAQPVLVAPGRRSLTNDQALVQFQIYF
jgi:phosphate-selective porin OprO and OprP